MSLAEFVIANDTVYIPNRLEPLVIRLWPTGGGWGDKTCANKVTCYPSRARFHYTCSRKLNHEGPHVAYTSYIPVRAWGDVEYILSVLRLFA